MRLFSLFFVLLACHMALASNKKSTKVDEDSILDQILADPKLSSVLELDDPDKLLEMLRTHFAGRLEEDEERTIDRCAASNKRLGMIIRTQESQAAGAVFLGAPHVQNRQECIDYCCDNSSCTTAIVREQVDGEGCYLFNCLSPSVCLFSSNEKFSSYDLSRSSNSRLSTSMPVVNTKPSMAVVEGHLYSSCDEMLDCFSAQHVECVSGYCMCQSDYHAVGSSCRRNCGQYQFECLNENNPEATECIPVYNQCDGIEQCEDGSDEFHCVDTLASDNSTLKSKTVSQATKTKNSTSVPAAFSKTNRSSPVPSSEAGDRAKVTRQPGINSSSDDDENSSTLDREKWTVPAVKGAIVTLVLGVLVVIALLVFGCCQLQRMRWSSRKGRMRSGNDADYLINGLYL